MAYGRSGGIAVDVCKGGAIIERIFSNAYYGVGDGYGGEGGAIRERIGQDGNLTTTAAAFNKANTIDTRFEHREGVLYGEGGFTSVDEEFAHGV